MSNGAWDRIELARERWNVLRHPFYRRWSEGKLSMDELARYSGQYRHVVEAIATASEHLAEALPERPELGAHASEELGHVDLWDGFVRAAHGDDAAAATPETAAFVRELTGGDTLAMLASLYAIESGQPQIASVKRQGLVDRYGFGDGPDTAYFRVHEARDAEHAAQARELIEELAVDGDADRVVATAESAFRANWRLLDGV